MRRMLTMMKNKANNFVTGIKEDFTPNRKLSAEQRDRKTLRSVGRILTGMMLVSMMSTCGLTAFAAGDEGVETFNTVVQFIVNWVGRIGMVIAFVGAVQFALAFKDDSADGKARGLMCLASGFIVFAVSKAYNMFKA